MSDEIKQEPFVEAKSAGELSPDELDKVNGGGMFTDIITAVTGTGVSSGTIVSPRDASTGLSTGKRL